MKNFYFILSLAIMALFSACSNDMGDFSNPKNEDNPQRVSVGYHPTYKYAFAIKTPETRTKAFNTSGLNWKQHSTINIKFLNGSPEMQEKVKDISKEWQQYINLTFNFLPSSATDREAQVRISFAQPNTKYSEKMTWSYIGWEACTVRRGETAHIGMFNYNDPTELNSIDFKAQVLRTFGYILGLIPEHLAPASNVHLIDDEALYYYSRYGFKEDLIYKYIIDPYTEAAIGPESKEMKHDPKSIMQIYIPNELLEVIDPSRPVPDLEVINTELSENDIIFIQALYPITKADPYKKGKTGEVFLRLISGEWYDDRPVADRTGQLGIAGYDWENKVYSKGRQTRKYKTIGVGEYEWFSENLRVQYRQMWGTWMNWFNITDDEISRIVGSTGLPKPPVNDFIDLFGTWITDYNSELGCIRNEFFIYDKKDGTLLTGWDMPDCTAMLQMIGQMPVKYADYRYNFFDFVSANAEIDTLNSFGIPFMTRWSSISGLKVPPMGLSSNEPAIVRDKYYDYGIGFGLKMKGTARGLFCSERKGSNLCVNHKLYHFCSARYCRPYTDEELGYKMYYSVKNDDVIYRMLGSNPNDNSYIEIPRGLERGVALRHTYRDPGKDFTKYQVVKKWSEIKAEAASIISKIDLR